MGFESSRAASRRLAALAATNQHLQSALAPASYPDLFADGASSSRDHLRIVAESDAPAEEPRVAPTTEPPLVDELDALAQDIVATPGAGGALLASYAAQARALSLIVEAARRSGERPLPASVLLLAQAALLPPPSLAGLALL